MNLLFYSIKLRFFTKSTLIITTPKKNTYTMLLFLVSIFYNVLIIFTHLEKNKIRGYISICDGTLWNHGIPQNVASESELIVPCVIIKQHWQIENKMLPLTF